jgi:hypothetical protein
MNISVRHSSFASARRAVTADASDLLFVESAMIYQDQIQKWEAKHPGR